MKYQHKKTFKVATLIEKNDKSKMVTLQLEDGTYTSPTFSTFQRWWKKIDEDQPVETVIEEVQTSVEEDTASDGTPYTEVMNEILQDEKKAVKQAKKSSSKKKSTDDISEKRELLENIAQECGYTVKWTEKTPRRVDFVNKNGKTAAGAYMAVDKCVFITRVSCVPDGMVPDRTRNCPMGAAFDISYDDVKETVSTMLSKIVYNPIKKTKKKEEN